MVQLAYELPGDWSSAWIFVRLLMLGDSRWEPDEEGFLVHRSTGERVHLEMYPPSERLDLVYADGICPIRPTVDDTLLQEIAAHRSTIRLSLDRGITGPQDALTLLRAATAVVDSGALAIRCTTSGLAHAADTVGPLLARAEAAADVSEERLAEALYESFVLIRTEGRARTFGMHALDRPDVLLRGPLEPDLAAVRLEDEALRVLREGELGEAHADPTSKADPRYNPHGVLFIDP